MSAAPAGYAVGDRVRVSERTPIGHHRTPIYVRGKTGHIERVLGRRNATAATPAARSASS